MTVKFFICFLFISTFLLFESFTLTDGSAVMAIDIGSEWIKVAIVKPGVPMEIVLNKESKRKTDAAVSMRDGERNFGSSAMTKGVKHPTSTYFYLRELLAKPLDNPIVQQYQERFPHYKFVEDPQTKTVLFAHQEDESVLYSPEELLAMILNNSKSLAEEYAQAPMDTTILTVPPYFNQAERKSLLYAADLAGLNVAQLIDDNVAAALNYGVFRRNDINATANYVMFYDMGATSTVATIISYQMVKANGVSDPQLAVKGMGFDRTLGGLEFDFRLRDLLVERFNEKKKTKSDVRSSPRAMAKLLKEAKRVKRVLSANTDIAAQIEGLLDDEDFRTKVTRQQLEEICADLWPRVANPIKEALKAADLPMESISQLILLGGGTRVPKVQDILLKESGKSDLGRNINADEAFALGASYQAAALSSAFRVKEFHVKSGAPYPIEINFDRETEQEDGTIATKHIKRTLFQRGNPYPQRKVITFNRFYKDFKFLVSYGDVSYLNEQEKEALGNTEISSVFLRGVGDAHEKYGDKENTEPKGVKAHFRMDESGVLNLESAEAVYEQNKTVKEEVVEEAADDDSADSTFQKIKDGLSGFFSGGKDDEKEEGKAAEDTEAPSTEEATDDKEAEKEEEQPKSEEGGEEPASEDPKEEKPEEPMEKEASEEKTDGEKSEEAKADDDSKPEEPKADEEAAPKNATKTLVDKVVKIKQTAKLDTDITAQDIEKHSEDSKKTSIEKLLALAEIDAYKEARERAMNRLESFIYDKKDKMYQEMFEEAMTEEERDASLEALTEASDWLEWEMEGEPGPEVFDERREKLKAICRPWLLRVRIRRDIVPLMKDIEELFNYTSTFIKAMEILPEDAQIYTEVEITKIKELYAETVEWKNTTAKAEAALKPYEDPVLKQMS